jgi:DNA-binding NarL/FixJ family response regulator
MDRMDLPSAARGSNLVVLIDDHPMILSALRDLITASSLRADVRTFSSIAASLAVLRNDRPALVIVDLALPDISGAAAVELVRQAASHATVAVLSGDSATARAIPAICKGLVPFLDKGMRTLELTKAIHELLHRCGLDDGAPADDDPAQPHLQGLASLSTKQRETLRLLSTGRTNEEIAKAMNLSRETVKTHLSDIFSKMQVKNRIQAVMLYQRAGRGGLRNHD